MYIVIGEQDEWTAMQCSKFKAPCSSKTHSYSACRCVPQTDSQLGPALISWQQYWHRNRNSDEDRTLAVCLPGLPSHTSGAQSSSAHPYWRTYCMFTLDTWWSCKYSLWLRFKGTVSHFGKYTVLPRLKWKYGYQLNLCASRTLWAWFNSKEPLTKLHQKFNMSKTLVGL